MSLRRRLFLILLVSCVALGASVVGVARLLSLGSAVREATAASAGWRAMLALAYRLDGGIALTDPALAPLLETLARTLDDGTVGVCTVEGIVRAQETVIGPSRWDRSSDMLPLDRDCVVHACRAATSRAQTVRVLAPTDVLSIATVRTQNGAGPVVFVLARVPASRERVSTVSIILLALAGVTTAVLLGLTAHGSWVLRTSTESLQASLDALEHDLRAPLAEPKAVELASVARHLRTLASTLADSQERERALAHHVEEQRRLAGLGRVVAGVAHEVRNPLAGIKLRLDSMALRQLDTRTRQDVDKCLREVGRLDRLVRMLLLASRDRTPQRVPFEAAAMVDERIALAAPLARAGDVLVEREGDATIVGEREELCGAFDNLVRNAIEASPRGGRVQVRVHTETAGVSIVVIDEGPGIAHERVGELFEPFFTTKGSGTGLGLVLARAAVEAHGGSLRYERCENRTVFSVVIPHITEIGANHG